MTKRLHSLALCAVVVTGVFLAFADVVVVSASPEVALAVNVTAVAGDSRVAVAWSWFHSSHEPNVEFWVVAEGAGGDVTSTAVVPMSAACGSPTDGAVQLDAVLVGLVNGENYTITVVRFLCEVEGGACVFCGLPAF